MRHFHIIGSEVVEAQTRRLAAERAYRYRTKPEGAMRFGEEEATWGVWCTVTGGITGHRQAWLEATGPGSKNPAAIALFTEGAARAKADDLNREMRRNRAARFSYTAREI